MIPFRLRPLTPDDLDHLVTLDQDPEVTRYINGGQATPRAAYVELLLPRMLGAATRPGLGFFAVESPEGDFMGWVHLREDSFEPRYAEIGYRLARAYWGQGVATAASRLLMARAFEELGFEVVSARTLLENRASRRVMEKLGLSESGRFVYPARTVAGLTTPELPAVLYTLHRGDWAAPR
ncbi:GNAT family N-acetyltransferase [Myxococcota bacterium]|nr:GNAT family N-acetyltransferase [Myxococcota bacterium]